MKCEKDKIKTVAVIENNLSFLFSFYQGKKGKLKSYYHFTFRNPNNQSCSMGKMRTV